MLKSGTALYYADALLTEGIMSPTRCCPGTRVIFHVFFSFLNLERGKGFASEARRGTGLTGAEQMGLQSCLDCGHESLNMEILTQLSIYLSIQFILYIYLIIYIISIYILLVITVCKVALTVDMNH